MVLFYLCTWRRDSSTALCWITCWKFTASVNSPPISYYLECEPIATIYSSSSFVLTKVGWIRQYLYLIMKYYQIILQFLEEIEIHEEGGGILVAVNNRFQSRLISTHEYIEQINVEMITRGSPDKYLQNVLKAGSLDTSKPTLLLGDFNCPDIDWSASHFVIRLNLVQLVTQYLGHNSNHNVPHQFDICFQRIL